MLQEFLEFIEKQKLFTKDEKVLLGVSGGIDSMVMADLFQRAGFRFGIAHCNFKLRGIESEKDETFVTRFAEANKIPFFPKAFSTTEHASSRGISIQMAARELRRKWMESVAESEGYSCCATAHHLDDEAETFFLNMLRGTGIAGLHGILPKSGQFIHPMLFTGRQDIIDYVQDRRIEFREDASNRETDYARNKIRHLVIPELEKIKPGFRKVLTKDIANIRSIEIIYRSHLSETWNNIASEDEHGMRININKLKELPEFPTYLFEFLQRYGFNASDTEQMAVSLDGQAGKQFFSKTHRVILDRDSLIIGQNLANESSELNYLIQSGEKKIERPVGMTLRTYQRSEGFHILEDPWIAQLDADTVDFPLNIRKWRKGDRFYPLGMKTKKLLSDFFTDLKLSRFQKGACWIMTSNDDIIWIIGHRIDDRFKVTGSSKNILEIRVDHKSEDGAV